MRFGWKRTLLVCALFVLYGCVSTPQKPFYLQKTSFSALPDWGKDDMATLIPALQKNCQVMQQQTQWRDFCNRFTAVENSSPKKIRRFIEQNMTPYAVFENGTNEGLFTGYYEATLTGSLSKDDKNMHPIYGFPEDLVVVDTKTICDNDNKLVTGRIENGRFIPSYYTRDEIDEEKLKAPVLLWVSDPVDAFILHIQGSGRVETHDGIFHIGYAGNNGHPFVGIGSIMAKEGVLEPGKASMPEIKKWLQNNPQKAQELMKKNPRYIFFKMQQKNADGPLGALGVPLTARRSIAVDTDFIPLGSLLYLDTTLPDGQAFRKLVVAQDKGGAIKGAIRGDLFWGYGDEAFQNAGRMKSKGKYYLLYPKGFPVPTLK